MSDQWRGSATAAIVALAALSSATVPAQDRMAWVVGSRGADVSLSFGGVDSSGQLSYVSHGFSCAKGTGRGALLMVEGMGNAKPGSQRATIEAPGLTIAVNGTVSPNEEAGSNGFEAPLAMADLERILATPTQVFIVAGGKRVRFGLRGAEAHRERFLAACR